MDGQSQRKSYPYLFKHMVQLGIMVWEVTFLFKILRINFFLFIFENIV